MVLTALITAWPALAWQGFAVALAGNLVGALLVIGVLRLFDAPESLLATAYAHGVAHVTGMDLTPGLMRADKAFEIL